MALRMMTRTAKKKQGSSVSRNIFPPRRIKNLRATEKIFSLSVALEAFHSKAEWSELRGNWYNGIEGPPYAFRLRR
jgi:hypothetical protein